MDLSIFALFKPKVGLDGMITLLRPFILSILEAGPRSNDTVGLFFYILVD